MSEPAYSPHFTSPEHALLTGMLLGELLRQDVDATPVIDPQSNYTDMIAITIRLSGRTHLIRVRVLP
jgi:hypothetical protein